MTKNQPLLWKGAPQTANTQTRRRFLRTVSIASAASLLRAPVVFAAEERLETTTLRLAKMPDMCMAPQLVAEELLREEGFTGIEYIDTPNDRLAESVGSGEVDMSLAYISQFLTKIDGGAPIVLVAGVMVGCIELFAQQGIRSVGELKGKKIAVRALGSSPHGLISATLAHVGLNPKTDVEWVADPAPAKAFAEGRADAVELVPPASQELRARKIGHVIVNNAIDRPWSQYFCCMLGGHRDFVRKNPVAVKRVIRAMLKANDLCSKESEKSAKFLVDRGFTPRYDFAVEALRDNIFDKWRDYDAEDTVRFYALRLHDVGFIKSNPQKLIAEAADWRAFNELRRELKA
jgi:NitT/TauT family transport system substrate-binding protein